MQASFRNSLWNRVLLATGLLLICGGVGMAADEQPAKKPTEKQIQFFEKKIRPLMVQYCNDCHGADEQESELRLDTWAGLIAGGKAGASIVPGKPEQSLLITAVKYQDNDLKMPPEERLSKQQIADLVAWIKMGAPHPDSDGRGPKPQVGLADIEKGKQFWAFQAPKKSELPKVSSASWPKNEIDRFILSQLEQKELKPAAVASKRTLIRRATFDLIGLPPTPKEIDAFLADDSPSAFETVIDRLLASKHYGERWGRHWLDVARYADSNGLDENVAHGNAWRYRDYVVNAFNSDKPFDQFVSEQLAGDLLPAENVQQKHEQFIATAFLSLGPKVLAEVDEQKMEMDIIDEQIETFGRVFLGLTLGCARCHAHKFDPVDQADYYALSGIFKSTKTMENFKKVAKWWENSLATEADLKQKADHEKQLRKVEKEILALSKAANAQLKKEKGGDFKLPKQAETLYPKETQEQLAKLKADLAELKKQTPELPSAMGVTEGTLTDVAIHIRGSHLTQGDIMKRGFVKVMAYEKQPEIPSKQSGRLQLAEWLVHRSHPLTSRVMVNRVWRWHFGKGIVPTTDNFGRLGEAPINQPLLDWLAVWFQENGWSIKSLHRMIMLSATYQMSSQYNDHAATIDSENSLQWRFDVRRLEAEAIRDSLLAVGGLLDHSLGGSLLHVKNRDYFFDHTSKDETNYDSTRRSLYLPVVRNNLYDVFQLFDYADASVMNGNRSSTTIAPQALFLMNSELVHKTTTGMAKRVLASSNMKTADRVTRLYSLAYGRLPTEDETNHSVEALKSFDQLLADVQPNLSKKDRSFESWRLLCQVIASANEFIYIN